MACCRYIQLKVDTDDMGRTEPDTGCWSQSDGKQAIRSIDHWVTFYGLFYEMFCWKKLLEIKSNSGLTISIFNAIIAWYNNFYVYLMYNVGYGCLWLLFIKVKIWSMVLSSKEV